MKLDNTSSGKYWWLGIVVSISLGLFGWVSSEVSSVNKDINNLKEYHSLDTIVLKYNYEELNQKIDNLSGQESTFELYQKAVNDQINTKLDLITVKPQYLKK